MTIAAVIVAAGRGSRARGDAKVTQGGDHGPGSPAPKQYAVLGGVSVLAHTLRIFLTHPAIDIIQVVIHPDDAELYAEAVRQAHEALADGPRARLLPAVHGSATRQGSVMNGLDALAALSGTGITKSGSDTVDSPQPVRNVLIHDAARPFLPPSLITSVLEALAGCSGAIAALPLSDTLKRAGSNREITGTIERLGLWRAQTPQGFRFSDLHAAHSRARNADLSDFTDDAAVAEWAGMDVRIVAGSAENIKLTTAEDMIMAEARAAQATQADAVRPVNGDEAGWPDIRVGNGFDVHRFTDGDHVWLCGVKLAHARGLDGHSDADVGLHALTDAILGAISDGDIGAHFPPSDKQWKNAASDQFLADAARRVAALGGRINHVDVTLLCELPKIGPHRDEMRAAIAGILKLPIQRVAVKATTTEKLGFTGRGEGIAAMASATVLLPPGS